MKTMKHINTLMVSAVIALLLVPGFAGRVKKTVSDKSGVSTTPTLSTPSSMSTGTTVFKTDHSSTTSEGTDATHSIPTVWAISDTAPATTGRLQNSSMSSSESPNTSEGIGTTSEMSTAGSRADTTSATSGRSTVLPNTSPYVISTKVGEDQHSTSIATIVNTFSSPTPPQITTPSKNEVTTFTTDEVTTGTQTPSNPITSTPYHTTSLWSTTPQEKEDKPWISENIYVIPVAGVFGLLVILLLSFAIYRTRRTSKLRFGVPDLHETESPEIHVTGISNGGFTYRRNAAIPSEDNASSTISNEGSVHPTEGGNEEKNNEEEGHVVNVAYESFNRTRPTGEDRAQLPADDPIAVTNTTSEKEI